MLRGLVFIIFFTNCLVRVKSDICYSTDVRSDPRRLQVLQNCTRIVGNLQIVLMERSTQQAFLEYSFPKLQEITGYLLVYKVDKLSTIGSLFPNLRVIRGNKLFRNYALIIYNNADLTNIGLSKLSYIGRGGVIIDRCPNLCYVNTIDWEKIGVPKRLVTYKGVSNCTEPCHKMCGILFQNKCWSLNLCQIDENKKCHSECIGCSSESSSPKNCILCKNYRDQDECVSECPKYKYLNTEFLTCVTAEECQTKYNWNTFENYCAANCPAKYKLTQPGNTCEPCNGTCHKTCVGDDINSLAHLEKFFGCTYVHGSINLQVTNIHMVEELEFFLGSIEVINGSLTISHSPDISSLTFFKELKLITGNDEMKKDENHIFRVFKNANLKELIDVKIEKGRLFFFDNPQLCLNKIMKLAKMNNITVSNYDVSRYSNGPEAACVMHELNLQVIKVNAFDATLQWDHPRITNEDELLGYTIFYAEVDAEKSPFFGGNDVCDLACWKSTFVTNNTVQLTKLKPFTNYTFYINVLKANSLQEKSETFWFRTEFGDPEPPLNFRAIALSSDTIQLKWNKPTAVNGILNNYEIFSYIEDFPSILKYERNYCRIPHAEDVFWNDLESYTMETSLEDLICNCDNKKNSKLSGNICDTDNDDNDADSSKSFVNKFKHKRNKTIPITGLNDYKEFDTKSPEIETLNATNLKHFTVYIFYISACNNNPLNSSDIKCSTVVQAFERTMKSKDADKIPEIHFETSWQDVEITWKPPVDPNGMVVAYNILIKGTYYGLNRKICISTIESSNDRLTVIEDDKVSIKFIDMEPDVYEVQVQAISLAGNGPFIKITFTLTKFFSSGFIESVVCILLIAVVIIILNFRDRIRIFYSLSNLFNYRQMEEYTDFERYVDIKRSNLELNELQISTNFVSIYKAILKSNKACTAKVFDVGEGFNYREIQSLFRNEVARNSICNCNHVLKLYGIVSSINAPIIVYEYLGLGDLKHFLRETVYELPVIQMKQIYRMIAEVADAMVYLGINGIVHKDLSARNCIVTSDYRVKVGDLGVSQTVYREDYYELNGRVLPVRWMAPESLEQDQFSIQSDVWSFGVLVWEILTLAQQPYTNVPEVKVIEYVISGGLLPRPLDCTDDLYELMMDCWAAPVDRPRFADIVLGLNNHLDEGFRTLSYVHTCEKPSQKRSLFKRNPIIVGRFSDSSENVNLILN